jgi:hypothetical protein
MSSSLGFRTTQLNDLSVDVALASVARGDVLFRGASKWNNLAPGTAGQYLQTAGAGADPVWATVDLTTRVAKAGDTMTGALTISATGVEALKVTGAPAASATEALVRLGAALVGGSANGAYLGGNVGSGYTGDLVHWQQNGVTRLRATTERLYFKYGPNPDGFEFAAEGLAAGSGPTLSFFHGGLGTTKILGSYYNTVIVPGGGSPQVNIYANPHPDAVYALLRLGTAALVAGSAAGTYFGLNAASGYTGDLVNFQKDGASVFRMDSAGNITLDTTTGAKLGTATAQKLGFWNATPVVQPAGIVDADGTLADATTKLNSLLTKLETIGLLAAA